jgi:ATP-dependent RNA helicase RhlE
MPAKDAVEIRRLECAGPVADPRRFGGHLMTPDNLQDDDMSFNELGLRVELLKAVESNGYTTPTPIQSRVIPAILDGQDILARAQTGTGKTDAFSLPVVEILSRQSGGGRHPRALVLTPTRELALQVGECIKAYARRVSLRCTVVYGGVRTSPQIDRLRRGIDILVATPGRLLDLAGQGALNLSRIEFLVFDEADRMLDMGFNDEISEIIDLVPSERRTMLFSATYTRQIRHLAGIMLIEPSYIEVTPSHTAAESVVQKVHLVDRTNKRPLLIHLITRGNWTQVLVFTRTKHGANKLTEKLAAKGISAAALHSNKSQSFRTRTLKEFKSGDIRILVATDVAARGLDISNLPYVVNYDMPHVPEDYIHRIGRTGRAGVSGIAVSLVSHDEKPYLQAIEKLLNRKLPTEKIDGYTEDSAVPDFVLFRPDSPSSEQKADPAIKEWVSRRKAVKERSKIRRAKTIGSKSKSRSGSKKSPVRTNKSPSATRSHQTSKQGKPRGRR